MIKLCKKARQRREFTWSLSTALLMGALGFLVPQLGALIKVPLWITAIIGVVLGATGFHVVPNYLFGEFIAKQGENEFMRKAAELGVAELAQKILDDDKVAGIKTAK